jgi:hypothetical protein
MGIIVEPYTLPQFVPAVVIGITARGGKHAILCTKERTKERWVSRTERSLAQNGGEMKRVCAVGFAKKGASRVL